MLGNEVTQDFLARLDDLLDLLLPAYEAEGKSYLTLGLRVHRRPAPLGGHRRGGRQALAQARPRASGAAPRPAAVRLNGPLTRALRHSTVGGRAH